jgi:hypothetical protein
LKKSLAIIEAFPYPILVTIPLPKESLKSWIREYNAKGIKAQLREAGMDKNEDTVYELWRSITEQEKEEISRGDYIIREGGFKRAAKR